MIVFIYFGMLMIYVGLIGIIVNRRGWRALPGALITTGVSIVFGAVFGAIVGYLLKLGG